MSIFRAVETQIYPDEKQIDYCKQASGCSFLVFNMFKDWKDRYYDNYKYNVNEYEFKFFFNNIVKKSEEYSFLKDIDSLVLESAIEHVTDAYNRYFSGQCKKPKFKNKRKDERSFTTKFVNNNIEIIKSNGNMYIKLPKIKLVKMSNRKSKYIKDYFNGKNKIKKVTVKYINGSYYASIMFKYKESLPETKLPTKIMAGDLGLKCLIDLFDGVNHIEIANNKYLEESLKKIQILSKAFSKKKLYSKNWYKTKNKLAKLYRHIANQRKDYNHKVSRYIADESQVYICEDLDVKSLLMYGDLSRQIGDAGWAQLITFIKYKMEANGGKFVKINRYFPSSRLCNCGYKNNELKLSDRIWTCPACGKINLRDANASENIYMEGARVLGLIPTAT